VIDLTDIAYRSPVLGPLIALIIACVVFALATSTFFTVDNLSLILQQSVVVGTLCARANDHYSHRGIDLANGAIMVIGRCHRQGGWPFPCGAGRLAGCRHADLRRVGRDQRHPGAR